MKIEKGKLITFISAVLVNKERVGLVEDVDGDCIKAWYYNQHTNPIDIHKDRITGVYDVINFDDESKSEDVVDMPLDELKVYTGKEALQELLVGKIMNNGVSDFKFEGEDLLVKTGKDWIKCYGAITHFLECRFTEVVTPQVGDWVKTCGYVGQITKVDGTYMYAHWSNIPHMETPIFLKHDWQILSPEEVSEYKREQAFTKVGRKLNEFKRGDIVYIESVYRVAIVASNNNTSLINLHGINEEGKGYTAKPHQLTPISFVEQQVDLS
ncbi:hypothetical protein [Bacillus cereus]|uniref:hypothetical protein n=1 Tax=Bacillus cereus TaxID=1396 RepID=UPI000BF816EB|nr:hypothetical protein [Bacillus cereus]PFK68279.1 hypothetical protein COJ25_17230 [Bacillus cereus]